MVAWKGKQKTMKKSAGLYFSPSQAVTFPWPDTRSEWGLDTAAQCCSVHTVTICAHVYMHMCVSVCWEGMFSPASVQS